MTAAVSLRIAGWAAAGLGLGAAFFTLLRLNVALYGSRHWLAGIGLHLARWALLVAALVFAARGGALPLLSAALGTVAARAVALPARRMQP
ncbi:MAG TPA: ATP synthase subunit I [Polyangia bacterium]|nr:ATP synthase subunit I [Polyangia bacterium]